MSDYLDGETNRVGRGAIELDNRGVQEIENTGKMKTRFCPSQALRSWKDNWLGLERKVSLLDFRGGAV